jgi:hypothetical protein
MKTTTRGGTRTCTLHVLPLPADKLLTILKTICRAANEALEGAAGEDELREVLWNIAEQSGGINGMRIFLEHHDRS